MDQLEPVKKVGELQSYKSRDDHESMLLYQIFPITTLPNMWILTIQTFQKIIKYMSPQKDDYDYKDAHFSQTVA